MMHAVIEWIAPFKSSTSRLLSHANYQNRQGPTRLRQQPDPTKTKSRLSPTLSRVYH
jgi:hypothetical protein